MEVVNSLRQTTHYIKQTDHGLVSCSKFAFTEMSHTAINSSIDRDSLTDMTLRRIVHNLEHIHGRRSRMDGAPFWSQDQQRSRSIVSNQKHSMGH